MTAYLTYIKIAAAALILGLWSWLCYHQGGLPWKTKLEAQEAAQSSAVTTAVLKERADAQAQALTDNKADATHDQDIAKITTAPPRSDPVFVYRPGALCAGTVPGSQAQAAAVGTDPKGGGVQPGSGAVDIRPELERLKLKYETVLADYRRLDAEWPGNSSNDKGETK